MIDIFYLANKKKEKILVTLQEDLVNTKVTINLAIEILDIYYSNLETYYYDLAHKSFSKYFDVLKDTQNNINELFTQSTKLINVPKFKNILFEINQKIEIFLKLTKIDKEEIEFIRKKLVKNLANNNNIDKQEKNILENKVDEKEKSISTLENEISKLKQEVENNKEDSKKIIELQEKENKLKKEMKELEKHKEKAEKLDLYLDEKAKIESAIEKLKITSEDLKDEKENFKRARTNFTMYSTFAFTTSLTALVLTALYFYFNRYYIDTSSLNLTYYLFCVFPILFPSVIGFLFVRQANVNSIEISKINKRFVLIHEVNQSLQALVEINRGKDMDDKTERVIDKLIDNILADTTGTPIQNNEIELNASQMDELLNKIYESIKNKADIVKDVSGA